jgi:hypothetical protein
METHMTDPSTGRRFLEAQLDAQRIKSSRSAKARFEAFRADPEAQKRFEEKRKDAEAKIAAQRAPGASKVKAA